MRYCEYEPPARRKHACDLGHAGPRLLGGQIVEQEHREHTFVVTRLDPTQIGRITGLVRDPERFTHFLALGCVDHSARHVDPVYFGSAAAPQRARAIAFATSEVEHAQAIVGSAHLEHGRPGGEVRERRWLCPRPRPYAFVVELAGAAAILCHRYARPDAASGRTWYFAAFTGDELPTPLRSRRSCIVSSNTRSELEPISFHCAYGTRLSMLSGPPRSMGGVSARYSGSLKRNR